MKDTIDAATGVLLGLACGDAVGRPVEFATHEEITRKYGVVTDMLAHGVHDKPAGAVTDDTELALCIARSLVEKRRFDGEDIAERFVEWYDSDPFGIGSMTADALSEYKRGATWDEAGKEVWERRNEGENAGNGSVMRCAPLALAFADTPETLATVSRQSSAITHYDPRCTYGCIILNHTIAGYLRNDPAPLENALSLVERDGPAELVEPLSLVLNQTDELSLSPTGYVVDTLQTALYDAITAESAEDAIVTAVNRGGDTDTIGAIAGAVAGARFGAGTLPNRWLESLQYRDELEQLAKALVTTEMKTETR
ncbi:ADP-ribosylglycohydrolase family protein [Halorubrum vacuolatum]|uniref:ADP-ribosyl-[dinitrogen reductase] hydrolase n=1 Tax=Halorubrum vacuolatum TaxID=63740 RepID=A0A238X4Z0_HALVU|nr:ADP-ribosylglycohydrolase family protein [Halorubrum vacuolatum]SNR54066.1 ADP-ribosyl-[dinitrogen reductase] hydrolase [Halorubrum vacuolatum]